MSKRPTAGGIGAVFGRRSKPRRPRPPGNHRSFRSYLEALPLQTIAIVAGVVVGGGLVVAFVTQPLLNRSDAMPEITTNSTLSADVLPLNLTDVGFASGTVDVTADDEGPLATGYCNHAATATGLIDWKGSRLTEQGDARRVVQLVATFVSSVHATAYLAETSSHAGCQTWEATYDEETVAFELTETYPVETHGDETRQYELSATTADGSMLFIRTLYVRAGREVAQFTYVSAVPEDLDRLTGVTATAADELGY